MPILVLITTTILYRDQIKYIINELKKFGKPKDPNVYQT